MNKTNDTKNHRTTAILRAVTGGATSLLVMNLSGLNISLNSGFKHLTIDFGSSSKAMALTTLQSQSALDYEPPYRGAPTSTQATGARGGNDYFAPDRGAPTSTQATGARGGSDYFVPDRGAPTSTQATGARGSDGYTVPDRGAPASTQGSGARGGNLEPPVTLTLLIPTDHTGRTTSGHPTFYWHMSSATTIPMEFTLVEPGVTQPIFVQRVAAAKVGTMQVEMPKDLPELATGKKYRWSVSLVRNSKRRSEDVFVQGWIERVPTTAELDKQLASATSVKRAEIYAKAGLWYDALAAISQASNEAPNDKSIVEERLSLLEQAGQTAVANQERQRLANN